MAADTLYEVLGVQPDASPEQLKAAFRSLSKAIHPDRGGSRALFQRVQEAYDTLSDPARRSACDRSLATGGEEHGSPHAEDSGWVRVDDPPGGGWEQQPPDPGPTYPPPRPQSRAPGPAPGDWAAPAVAPAEAGIGSFLARHPAGTWPAPASPSWSSAPRCARGDLRSSDF